jgi:phosphoserine phosphatase RsbX
MSALLSPAALIDWAAADAPMRDQQVSGDGYVVQCLHQGAVVAVMDGLGHGMEAATAAKIAAACVTAFPGESPLALMRRCHEQLKDTRGVVMTMAFFDRQDRTLTWVAVGNVDAVLFHRAGDGTVISERILLRSGLLGHNLPALRASVLPLSPGDCLIVATDGIRPEFAECPIFDGHPQQLADRVLRQFRTGTDDALVVVVRYLGGESQ